ncbi:hypothetical protein [Pseudomonas lundensis]|uniref:Uncharacterized protein n=1 Tax=Pseudomonas lundensis TaxID=86185 RepID=A0ABX4GK27_9PSED|nr:hypothetical protein [Pseudomonas lundensis]MCT8955048.1 hypothetical protein [Pseudomonas lundensis]OZY26532.1 hypothetical protein CJF40_18895 [Pseudomonas lundensis]OZY45255.1 hypothetical protein CJF41_16360 [Pseudomonas lundensis]OZY54100.1 hypothetical protein CJF38_16680 [Pseudomonas lundensis]
MEKIDVYLSRISHLVQVGLFSVTLLTIYYTVIPLYKSAQMEESLAKKEIELGALTEKADHLYSKVRKWEVSQFVKLASTSCAGWDEVIKGGNQTVPKIIESRVYDCIFGVFDSYDFSGLSNKDKNSIRQYLVSINSKIDELSLKFNGLYDAYPSELRHDPSLATGDKESTLVKMDEMLRDLGYKLPEKEIEDGNIRMGRAEITRNFMAALSDEIAKVENIDW